MISRYLSAIVLASGVTFGLFFIMQMLVASGSSKLNEEDSIKIMDMVRIRRDESIQRKDRRVEKPPEVEAPPPDVDIPQSRSLRPGTTLNIGRASVGANIDLGGGIFGAITDGDYLPIVKVTPIYPRRAAERGVEGYVLLEFTVTALGTVENAVVLESDPKGYFERSALNAARKFKYKPKVINGTPVPVSGVRNLITFELEDE